MFNVQCSMRSIQVAIVAGFHLFPFRTEKLSPPAPMVLHTRGRVGSRRFLKKPPHHTMRGLFLFAGVAMASQHTERAAGQTGRGADGTGHAAGQTGNAAGQTRRAATDAARGVGRAWREQRA